jgi:cobalt/nickel transport system ATP-binding protein
MHHSIEVTELHYTYPDGQQALCGTTLHVAPGEKVALVGPNGAGKSTLILHLNGILPVQCGELRVCGLDLRGCSKEDLARVRASVGLMFQQPDDQLFSPTVFEDVAFGPIYQGLPEAEVKQRVAKALADVHMSDFATRPSHHLSVGQKKRVAIATVLSMEPEVLVLDEPTAGLDPRGRRGLITLLHELPQTMLVSTHDLHMVEELFPRTVIMDEGRVAADGATADILANEAVLNAHGLEKP